MANLPEVSNFDSVYQIETTDPVQGGASGVTNTPLKNLTNRTKWLRDRTDALDNLIGRKMITDTAELTLNTGTPITLDAADIGTLYSYTVSVNTVVNLCAASSANKSGFIIQVRSTNASNITLTRAGSDTIHYENQTRNSFPVFAGESLFLISDGISKWFVLADTRDQSPAGSIIAHAANTAPSGYLKANGAAVSRTLYARLFATIGTTFGVGDGSTTFNIPDLRGEFIRGWADDRAVDTGRVFGSAQAQAIEAHNHQFSGNNRVGISSTAYGSNATLAANMLAGSPTTSPVSDNTGGTETRPRNVALLYCIKF